MCVGTQFLDSSLCSFIIDRPSWPIYKGQQNHRMQIFFYRTRFQWNTEVGDDEYAFISYMKKFCVQQ